MNRKGYTEQHIAGGPRLAESVAPDARAEIDIFPKLLP